MRITHVYICYVHMHTGISTDNTNDMPAIQEHPQRPPGHGARFTWGNDKLCNSAQINQHFSSFPLNVSLKIDAPPPCPAATTRLLDTVLEFYPILYVTFTVRLIPLHHKNQISVMLFWCKVVLRMLYSSPW